jgi:regulator of protease activity HflC (stomatin/prohibitin superfamily)
VGAGALVSPGFGSGSPAARPSGSSPRRSNTVTATARPARPDLERTTVLQRLQEVARAGRDWLARQVPRRATAAVNGARALAGRTRGLLVALAIAGLAVYLVYSHPPMVTVGRGEVGVRANRVTGNVSQWRDGTVLVLPGLHDMAVYSLRDRTYQPEGIRRADGPAPLQSIEGLSLGVDLSVRYALDPAQLAAVSKRLPEDISGEVVEPAVQGIVYKTFARYTVREIFSTKRVEIQQALESELKTKLAPDGIVLRTVQVGKVDLPTDYKRRMETLLAEELATQKMRYTLELKEKRVKEIALDGEAEKVRSEKSAEAAARAQVIAAKAQEEAMKHVLPFKQRQIEQRQLEAEAEKAARIRGAEGSAQARRIEASGEADARQKLADAEAYRLDRLGRVNAEQMAREGDLITRHPLLVQKALADKLSDKVQVIIAPPLADGGFVGASLLGTQAGRR